MNILLLLIPLSLLLLLAAVGAFVWAVRRGQFDDLDTPAIDILVDEPPQARGPRADAGAPADTAPHADAPQSTRSGHDAD
ncbi:cbb3-type cytochrome oxidase assembly protein CcoS [Luteimonas yindakuii]|uniref:Cbb3-type cytochrome oxidase assembly protein CcoS n=1 Tax=Luteimonas yindakuii TaxID=2565782 RepID=A0A4Z1RKR9_9GAMM|nr:cbb3-type cytochrome oxidase assembly protein CcoS [Luteimonas yindakuii]QCO68326.1 cbb3-type cytochrome oxidase assembly protein CcoS [Luteimonas yindakuii]TKS54729.1 cbb3-type cytochrome oxidase assembly protein CcoS [Luteimonas yindakuii]